MQTFAQKQNQPQRRVSSNLARSNTPTPGPHPRADLILHLQRTIGNQATQRLLQQAEPNGLEVLSSTQQVTRLGHDFSRVSVYSEAPTKIQAKLTVNTPGDIYEQEADRVSEQVMRMPEPQLQCACGGGCLKCQTEQPGHGHERLHTKHVESGDWEQTEVPPTIHEVLRSPGQPIDLATRAFMEPRFGHDFSHVRVHTDERAGDSARAVNALAYTVGRHLVFGVGQYSPTTASGRRLLAHELAHSVQQGSVANPLPQLVGDSGSAVQRKEAIAPRIDFTGSPEEVRVSDVYRGHEGDDLRNNIQALVENSVTSYVTYRDLISKSTPTEKRFALNPVLLSALKDTLDRKAFARCVESLGRRAPTFDELRNNSIVYQAIEDAWKASNPSADRIVPANEEGGWVYMNLIDGSLSTERALPLSKEKGTNLIDVNEPPSVDSSVVVATFHTHPNMGPKWVATANYIDKANAERRGVPNLVAGNPGTDPAVFQIFLAGPAVRRHLASDTSFPGRSGGIPP